MIILLLIMMITTMILPDKNMKKYAQFSLSLMFIFLFIQPVSAIFNVNFSHESAKIVDSLFGTITKVNLENEVDLKKKEIQATHDAYVIDEMEKQLMQQMKDEFAHQFNYSIIDVDIFVEDEHDINPDEIIFHFTLAESNQYISEVKPVIISTIDHTIEQENELSSQDQLILAWLSHELGITQDQVQISWEGG